ncbi:hypothetical protein MTO96_046711, partial [Rhipicephalus appendiculatus]
MPDRGGLPDLHRLCDTVIGANWRPTRFEDERMVKQYACCVCHVIPSTSVVLPCSHILCEQCLTGCAVQDGESVCPLDTEPFCEDEYQKLHLPDKKKRNLKAHCWNEADGCQFVGAIEAVLLHYDRECAFHALQCPHCERRILRKDLAAHYVTSCSEKCFPVRRPINEVSTHPHDISRAVGCFENSLQRGMESIETNICAMVTRQLNAAMEETQGSNKDPCSDQLASLQAHMNELVEQYRQRDACQIQEIGRVVRDCQIELKEDVQVQLQGLVPIMRVYESEMETMKTQLEELALMMRHSG